MNIIVFKKVILVLVVVLVFSYAANSVLAQTDQETQSSLYVPLIGISSVPNPLALPKGPGGVVYYYAVKNFLSEYPLTDIQVTDNKCSPVLFVEGDDNNDSKLDYGETWRYVCSVLVHETTQSIATVIGTAKDLPAAHKAYTTVVVGSEKSAPIVNIINVTRVAYPLTLPSGGGGVTFTYRVNNPGVVPLSDVVVKDDKCNVLSSRLGDTNGNNLLDIHEVWIYTCTIHLTQTTTNTVGVTASANGLDAVGYSAITVTVEAPDLPDTGSFIPCFPVSLESSRLTIEKVPCFPDTGMPPNLKVIVWSILSGVLAGLMILLFLIRRNRISKNS